MISVFQFLAIEAKNGKLELARTASLYKVVCVLFHWMYFCTRTELSELHWTDLFSATFGNKPKPILFSILLRVSFLPQCNIRGAKKHELRPIKAGSCNVYLQNEEQRKKLFK